MIDNQAFTKRRMSSDLIINAPPFFCPNSGIPIKGVIKMAITTEKELGQALKSKQDTIEIEGDLRRKIIRIKATGAIAWCVAIGAIAVAVVAILAAPATGGASAAPGVIAAPAAIGILGGATTASAISIAVAAGGIGALNTLRSYKIVENSGNRLVLKRK